jgi:hypothetical protein
VEVALFPVLEANQGAISVAALTIALAFALWEARRANTVGRERVREAVGVANDAILMFQVTLHSALDDLGSATSRLDLDERIHNAFVLCASGLEAIRDSAPPSARLLYELTDLAAELRAKIPRERLTDDALRTTLHINIDAVEKLRQRLRACCDDRSMEELRQAWDRSIGHGTVGQNLARRGGKDLSAKAPPRDATNPD